MQATGPVSYTHLDVYKRQTSHYMIHEGVMFRNTDKRNTDWKILVPEEVCHKLIVDYHERYGHQGQKKVVSALKEHFYINKLEKKVIRSIETCDICQKCKVSQCQI